MLKLFIQEYTKIIARYPEKISISENTISENTVELIVNADKLDAGKLIGKNGNTITALKTFASVDKSNINYKITVKAIDETKLR